MIPSRHHAVILTSVAVGVSIGLFVWLAPSRRIPPDSHLPRPQHVEVLAQDLLRERMKRHGADMRELVMAVVLLDFPQAQRLAERIGTDPGLPKGDDLSAELPAGFFTVLSDLKMKTARLAAVAGQGDHVAVAEAYGQLSQTCVGCHVLYAYERPAGRPAAPAPPP